MAVAQSAEEQRARMEGACPTARKLLAKYPDRVPVICKEAEPCEAAERQKKFLIPDGMSCREFASVVQNYAEAIVPPQRRAGLQLFLFVGGTRLRVSEQGMKEIYDRWRSEDGFLYVEFSFDQEPLPELAAPVVTAPAVAAPAPAAPSPAVSNFDFQPAARAQVAPEPPEVASPEPQPQGLRDAQRVFRRFPGRVPVICKAEPGLGLSESSRHKLAIPEEMLSDELERVVAQKVQAEATALVILLDGRPLEPGVLMREVYERHRSADGVLYLTFTFQAGTGSLELPPSDATEANVAAVLPAEDDPATLVTSASPELTAAVAAAASPSAVSWLEDDEPNEQSESASRSGTSMSFYMPDNDPDVVTDLSEARGLPMQSSDETPAAAPCVQPEPEGEEVADGVAAAAPPQVETSVDLKAAEEATCKQPQAEAPATGADLHNDQEAQRLRQRYPERVPIIVVPGPHVNLPGLGEKQFLVKDTMTCHEFQYLVYKKWATQACPGKQLAQQTLHLSVGGITPKTGTPVAELYASYASADGFLRVTVTMENTLGGH